MKKKLTVEEPTVRGAAKLLRASTEVYPLLAADTVVSEGPREHVRVATGELPPDRHGGGAAISAVRVCS